MFSILYTLLYSLNTLKLNTTEIIFYSEVIFAFYRCEKSLHISNNLVNDLNFMFRPSPLFYFHSDLLSVMFRLSICTTNHRFPLLLPRSNNENPLTVARAERARDHIVIHMMDPHSTFFVFILHTLSLRLSLYRAKW